MQPFEKKFLFLIVLGGRTSKSNVELHDVRWVVGSKIEDTFPILRRDWFGSPDGLHIDSYKKIKHVDGYQINFKNFDKDKLKNNKLVNRRNPKKKLYFVNVGGYVPNSMQEKHEFGLVVASGKVQAKNKAKSKWLVGCEKKHKDEISSLEILVSCDDCKLIKKIDDWEIVLTPDNSFIEENNYPDWYGYMRID